ncbi:CBS domain-containing protein [Chloroflexota bacterium]
MRIKDVSHIAGRSVITIGPDATVRQATEKLVQNKIGALPVCDASGAVLGIISERDILRTCATGSGSIDDTRVDTVMTKDLIVAVPEDDLDYISQVMINHGIRHLPVMSGPKLDSMISMRDIVNAQLADLEVQVRFLNAYISGGFV